MSRVRGNVLVEQTLDENGDENPTGGGNIWVHITGIPERALDYTKDSEVIEFQYGRFTFNPGTCYQDPANK